MSWAKDYGTDTEGEFVKFLVLGARFVTDALTMGTGVVGLTVGTPLNIAYLITQIVFAADPTQKTKWL